MPVHTLVTFKRARVVPTFDTTFAEEMNFSETNYVSRGLHIAGWLLFVGKFLSLWTLYIDIDHRRPWIYFSYVIAWIGHSTDSLRTIYSYWRIRIRPSNDTTIHVAEVAHFPRVETHIQSGFQAMIASIILDSENQALSQFRYSLSLSGW